MVTRPHTSITRTAGNTPTIMFRERTRPVSYTHLDVYKRQGYLYQDGMTVFTYGIVNAKISILNVMEKESWEEKDVELVAMLILIKYKKYTFLYIIKIKTELY